VGSGFERQGEESHGGTYTPGDGIEDLVCGGLQVEEVAAEVAVPGGAGRPAPSSVLRDPQHLSLSLSLSLCRLSVPNEEGGTVLSQKMGRNLLLKLTQPSLRVEASCSAT